MKIYSLLIFLCLNSIVFGQNSTLIFGYGLGSDFYISEGNNDFITSNMSVNRNYNISNTINLGLELKNHQVGVGYDFSVVDYLSDSVNIQFSKFQSKLNYSYFINPKNKIGFKIGGYLGANRASYTVQSSETRNQFIFQTNNQPIPYNSLVIISNPKINFGLFGAIVLFKNENPIKYFKSIEILNSYHLIQPFNIEENQPFRLFRNSYSFHLSINFKLINKSDN